MYDLLLPTFSASSLCVILASFLACPIEAVLKERELPLDLSF